MPFTFTHPAAVLPLRRLTPHHLSFGMLLIGSILPDLLYFVPGIEPDLIESHTLVSGVTFGLPAGLFIYALTYLLRTPFLELLPAPHRHLLAQWRFPLNPCTRTNALRLVASLWLGFATHVVWDGFTHGDGWFVERAPWLMTALAGRPLYSWLQYGSTLAGFVVLVLTYEVWLRTQGTSLKRTRWEWRNFYWLALFALTVGWGFVQRNQFREFTEVLSGPERQLITGTIAGVRALATTLLTTLVLIKLFYLFRKDVGARVDRDAVDADLVV